MLLNLTADEVLTTTRSVRKRLDLDRPVSRDLIEQCLDIALQAPNGSNRNTWHWVLVDDPAVLKQVARIYDQSMTDFITGETGQAYQKYAAAQLAADTTGKLAEDMRKMSESVDFLRRNLERMPAVVIPMFQGRPEEMDLFHQASNWGSVIPAVWGLFLALRARGLGSAWTTIHILREREMADLLGIPYGEYTQVGLFPIAYTVGTAFKRGKRKPVAEVSSWNRFGAR
jgi:nitroreductase